MTVPGLTQHEQEQLDDIIAAIDTKDCCGFIYRVNVADTRLLLRALALLHARLNGVLNGR